MKFAIAFAIAAVGMSGAAQANNGTYAFARTGKADGYGGNVEGERDRDGSRTLSASPASSASASWSNGALAGSAAASASLATGSLKSFSHAQGYADGYVDSAASAQLRDSLSFTVAGATAQTVTSILVDYYFHGQVTAGRPDVFAVTSEFHMNGAGLSFYFRKNGGQATPDFNYNQANFASSALRAEGDTYIARVSYQFLGASHRADMVSTLSTLAVGNATADYSNTASIRFTLPDNVTMTSASGVFLSQVGAIPEPSTWALLILGFGAVGGAMRRRVRATVAFA